MESLEEQGEKPIRLLSLDGGGIRGLSSLLILQYLMKLVNPGNPPKPCEYFDLIGGTSTGGLIAIMLGRLELDIETCITKYSELASKVFQPKRYSFNALGRAKDTWQLKGAFDSRKLEAHVKSILRDVDFDQEEKLRTAEPKCKVFVCANGIEVCRTVRLRSYRTATQPDEVDCKIWEAARATSAASTFFEAIKIGEEVFSDGATNCNNPVDHVMAEANILWPERQGRFDRVISIGTGRQKAPEIGQNAFELVKALAAISTNAEKTADAFLEQALQRDGLADRYFRFNVDRDLENVKLESIKHIGKIKAATRAYLQRTTVQGECLRCSGPSNSLLTDSSVEQESYLKTLESYDVESELTRIGRPMEGTLGWYQDCPAFREMRDATGKMVMVVQGGPGSGKSTLLAQMKRDLPDAVFFACSETQERRRSRAMVVSSLLYQILRSQRHLFRHMPTKRETWTYEQLLHSFQTILSARQNRKGIICIIDALDECHQLERRILARDLSILMENLQNQPSREYVRLIISSRKHPELDYFRGYTLDLDSSEDTSHDLHRFIHQGVQSLSELRPKFAHFAQEIEDSLLENSDGMFAQVDMVMRELECATDSSWQSLKEIICSIPPTIAELCDRIWTSIPAENLERATKIFHWLLCSCEPLNEDFLAFATAVSTTPEIDSISKISGNKPADIARDCAYLFGQLVRLGKTVDIAYVTVRHYFLGHEERHGQQIAHINEGEAHDTIALACLRYLNCDEFLQTPAWELLEQDAFLRYSLRFVSHHALLGSGNNESITREVFRLYEHKIWLNNLKLPVSALESGVLVHTHPPDPVSYCLRHRIALQERYFVTSSVRTACTWLLESTSGYGDFIPAIIRNLNTKRFQARVDYMSLLSASTLSFSNMADEDVENQLHSMKEDMQSAQDWLLDRIEKHSFGNASFEHWQAPQELFDTFNLILRSTRNTIDAYIDAGQKPDIRHCDGLHVMALLYCLYHAFRHDSDSNYFIAPSSRLLIHEIESYFPAAIPALLDAGIGVFAVDSKKNTPLHLAAQTGDYHIVDHLIRLNPSAVHSRNAFGQTPLHFACSDAYVWNNTFVLRPRPPNVSRARVVRQLLDAGADYSTKDQEGNSPLQTLARVYIPEWPEIPKNSPTNWREDDLHACLSPALLLRRVEDVLDFDGHGCTVLHSASCLWPVGGIRRLLRVLENNGILPLLIDHRGFTALHYAAIRGFEDSGKAVEVLVDAGIDPRVPDLSGKTAMDVAKKHGREHTLEALNQQRSKMIRQEKTKIVSDVQYNIWLQRQGRRGFSRAIQPDYLAEVEKSVERSQMERFAKVPHRSLMRYSSTQLLFAEHDRIRSMLDGSLNPTSNIWAQAAPFSWEGSFLRFSSRPSYDLFGGLNKIIIFRPLLPQKMAQIASMRLHMDQHLATWRVLIEGLWVPSGSGQDDCTDDWSDDERSDVDWSDDDGNEDDEDWAESSHADEPRLGPEKGSPHAVPWQGWCASCDWPVQEEEVIKWPIDFRDFKMLFFELSPCIFAISLVILYQCDPVYPLGAPERRTECNHAFFPKRWVLDPYDSYPCYGFL